jgi:hypothetical protein
LEGEVTALDEAGDVLVHPNGDQRVGVAEPLGDGRDRQVLGEEPDGVGVAQVADAQAAVIWPGLVESGGLEGAVPDAGEAAGREWLVGWRPRGVGEDIGDQGVRPPADVVGVDLVEREVAESGQDAGVDLGLDDTGGARMGGAPGWHHTWVA